MSIIASHVASIKGNAGNVIEARAMDMQRQGLDVIRLAAGEPDFDTPEHIKQAAIRAMEEGKTKYSAVAGVAELREAICEKFRAENGLAYEPDQVVVANGGKQIVFNALMATLDPGDEVIIPAPYWMSYPEIVRLGRGTPVFVETSARAGFRMSAEQLEAAITPKTKWLILNNPGNPTGAVYRRAELDAIARVLERHPSVWVLTDDIYEYLVYDGLEFATIAEVAPALIERTITLNGFSKAFCMTGWRVGYAAGPRDVINAMIKLQSQSTTGANTIAQWAAIAALRGPKDFVARHNASFVERRDSTVSMINQSTGLQCDRPSGAFYLYIGCDGLLGKRTPSGETLVTDKDVVEYFLVSEGVAVVPGEAFGLSPFFRISYATSMATLEDACMRIQRACSALGPDGR